eukprot:CAMPEP_0194213198 /NCGR_PEP_ID=MMETSP0156-20130528/13575_1 /TAXON_ID=33649 /ORGANISM="Thalassionema nitzschioides, Strain L26-B" /LENGTH=320 /DNA_ID=CAMNT_0038941175 /DNA_START=289 /DNA_END=1251 /DNA_ORIENTATION=-
MIPKVPCVRSSTSLQMFLGSDGGILGVGAPEVATILLVGYFVLGPSDLYKVTKEIGKFVQNFRSLGTEASKTLTDSMESQLELEEIRKAQRQLNDAFSFRRSINVDDESEFSDVTPEQAAAAEPIKNLNKKSKKKIRVRKKKKPEPEPVVQETEEVSNNIPDLDMTASFEAADEAEKLRDERIERLASGQPEESSWFDSEELPSLSNGEGVSNPIPSSSEDESNRFAQQLSGGWNESVLANEDNLGPLAQVMEKIALLEDERQATEARLEEEFRLRGEMEEKYYKKKRAILEDAAAEIQTAAYTSPTAASSQETAAENQQ